MKTEIFKTKQEFIDRAETRIAALKQEAANCGKCGHPTTSHNRLENDPGCYHTFGCVCLSFERRAA